ARAARVDEEVERGRAEGRPPGRLAGVPVAVKDNLTTLDYPTTCGSRILEGYRAPYEATAVRRLRAAGALIVGKTNLDEFAMGSSTENSAFGPTRNPWDPERVPGGSSGGSAAAVAAGLVPAALGSDTGGSVRQPAALCGVVGLKPTYGRVSRYGLVAFASSLDQVGTFGRTVEDAAALLEVIAGHDPLDSTSADRPAPGLLAGLDDGVEGLVVGVPREYLPPELDDGIRHLAHAAIARLEHAGAEVREISLPHTGLAIPTYYVIAPAEASSNLARYDGVRYGLRVRAGSSRELYTATRSRGFGPEVKRRIMLGTYALSAGYRDRYYGRAQRVRGRIAGDFRAAFEAGVDVIFTPTTPEVAFRLGERVADPYRMYLADVFTVTANLAGLPAVSVPIGEVDGLPVGGQLLADHWREPVMVRAAAALERELERP
ncbi:MAG: Asp-tRNA(Asn)/Glu-tRNA(Gln) amidotransferase subunit GatA, partial [Gemmatimonadetes bacterium]|nr:Asp-tRNA(Asn)/Glu-tRNA(Gln) amidotransferase subunit GatA [Gemmatimonadota bacterium]NIQ57899.1 Asp-tRNA(Asn)/Glu-tRNA(Gln) amidotransferase subunit GatA [Gemmatimonadota bacterium]NIU78061.1 Asp-tRNA(Asn)/Glu-tRNA(Gln) amidotransferase subunit GatA [Gammaproteobacteria bacterium]NIX47103.1 Asp-tRNA(Asn)/Glu-tRNA(Gln) amidotransferase subunit GatA [Gemmatimonadota bacterium]NIY11480.1 Asp-tRNA(Asn)/Glu-tRNA(Gln) amidotransferase subunit GatA [Gemmatimonadota bacterium]